VRWSTPSPTTADPTSTSHLPTHPSNICSHISLLCHYSSSGPQVNIPAYPALHADIQWRLVYGSLDQHLSAIRQKQDIAKTIRRLNEELPLTSVRYPVGAARFREWCIREWATAWARGNVHLREELITDATMASLEIPDVPPAPPSFPVQHLASVAKDPVAVGDPQLKRNGEQLTPPASRRQRPLASPPSPDPPLSSCQRRLELA
jgi:hypothetical protein